MTGVFARLRIEDVEPPHEIERPPPARANRLDLASVAPDIDIDAVVQRDLPHGHGAAEIERHFVRRKQADGFYPVAAFDALFGYLARGRCVDCGNGRAAGHVDAHDRTVHCGEDRDRPAILHHRAHFLQLHIGAGQRSEEHTSELQSLMRISYAVFCLKKKKMTLTSYY